MGKGISSYHQEELQEIIDPNETSIIFTKMVTEDLIILAIGRSQEGNERGLVEKLQQVIDLSRSTLIIGDMNICNKRKPTNQLKTYLEKEDFQSILNQATHIGGGHLDS